MPYWQVLLYIFVGTFLSSASLFSFTGVAWYGWMRIVRKQTKQQMFDKLASITRV